jgi:hypothetical protein
MNFFMNIHNKFYFAKKKIQEIYVGLLWPICPMKCLSYTWIISYSNFAASKPYKIWDYIKFKGT